MGSRICPSTPDDDWLISTTSPHHVPVVEPWPRGYAGVDRIPIAAA